MRIFFLGKNNTTRIVLIMLLVNMGLTKTNAQSFTVGNLNYTIINKTDKTVRVTGHKDGTNAIGTLSIPSSVPYASTYYSVVEIYHQAFNGCTGLTGALSIPNTVISIGTAAFSHCSGLYSITIPNSVTTIGTRAFEFCSGLSNITIPQSVTSINLNNPFQGCTGLNSIIVESGNAVYDSRNNCNAIIETSTNYLLSGCKRTTIPNSVTSIGTSAFSYCNSLTSITIPNSVRIIYNQAFYNCSGLTTIVIPNSVTNIMWDAFRGCDGLMELTIGEGVTEIGDAAFANCPLLTTVHFNATNCTRMWTGDINDDWDHTCSVFSASTGDTPALSTLTIGENVQRITYFAFFNCSNVSSITIARGTPPAVYYNTFEGIGNGIPLYVPCGKSGSYSSASGWNTFTNYLEECIISFTDINVKTICVANWDSNGDGELSTIEAAAVTSLGNVFKNNLVITSFDEFQYFTGLTSIGEDAFVNCSSLTSISIPNSVVSIGDRAFQNSGLVSAEFANSLLSIGSHTFEGCSFATLTLPNSLIFIGEGAFMYCTELTSITIPSSVSQIGNYAFSHCFGIEQMTVSQENATYTSSGSDAIIEISTNKLVSGCQNTVVPSFVVAIGQGAFDGCDNLTSIIIPNSVTTIGKDAFASCNNLASISLSENLESIGEMAFAVCENLTALTIPSTVMTMGFSVFSYCSNLLSLTLLPITPPSMVCYSGYPNFDGINPDIIAYVPYESLEEYSTASGWNELTYFQPIAYRTVSGYGTGNDKWIFVSSPLAANTEPDATAIENLFSASEYDLYRFNQAANGAEWENYKAHFQDFELENGQGYLYASKEDVNIIFKGVFNEGTSQTVSLECSGNGNLKGFNLVGNPFPVNAYINRPYYVMNDAGDAVIATAGSTNEPIAPCTGVFVRALENEVNPTVSFSTTQPRESSKGTINISLGQQINDSNIILDNAIVSFKDGDQLDKYVLKANNAMIYIPQRGKDYAIAIASRESEMPINFKASQNGEYTITVTPNDVEMDYLHLIDNFTGVDVDLLQTSSYTFSAKDDDNASRFVLTFKAIVIDGE